MQLLFPNTLYKEEYKMDVTIASLAGYIVSELAPYFSGFAKDMAKEAVSKLYEQIKAKFIQKSKADTLQEFERNPNSQDIQEDVRYYLEKYLRDDDMFAKGIADIVKEYHPSTTMTANVQVRGNQEFSPNIVGEHVHIYYPAPVAPQNQQPTPPVKRIDEITVYIKAHPKSRRFQKILDFTVVKDTRVSELLDLVIKKWNLPETSRIPEMMFEFSFGYSLSRGDEGLSDLKLSDLQIRDGDTIELGIHTLIIDQVEKVEFEESGQGPAIYNQARIDELIKRDKAKRARGTLTEERMDSFLNSFFAYIDK
jgi:hypothetical protein